MRRWSVRVFVCLALGLFTTVAIAWAASLQTRAGSIVRDGMTWRRRDPAQHDGEGWLRAHLMYKPAWRCGFGQAVPPLGYESWTPTPRTPEQAIRGHARTLTLPWLNGQRPWPAPLKGDIVYLDEYGWPFLALYTRRFGMLTADPSEKLLDLRSVSWFARRPLGDLGGLPIGIVWPGLVANTAIWSLPWAPLILARPLCRRFRLRRGLCPACGYSRAGLVAGTPCPECSATAR